MGLFSTEYANPEKDAEITKRVETVTQMIDSLEKDHKDRLNYARVTWVVMGGQVVPQIEIELFEKNM